MPTIFQPRFGRWLCLAIWALSGYGLAIAVQADGLGAVIRQGSWLGLAAVLVWALFWRPRVTVDDGGVHLVNVLRTIDVPWPAIQRIDTKWALTLITAYGAFTAWAAPAPGGLAVARMNPADRRELPESAFGLGGSIRPGDLPGTPSGAAAAVVRRRWEELRDAGYLDEPRLEFVAVPVRWHATVIAISLALLTLGLAAAIIG